MRFNYNLVVIVLCKGSSLILWSDLYFAVIFNIHLRHIKIKHPGNHLERFERTVA